MVGRKRKDWCLKENFHEHVVVENERRDREMTMLFGMTNWPWSIYLSQPMEAMLELKQDQ